MQKPNPYQSPSEEPTKARNANGLDTFAFIAWPMVLILNLLVPAVVVVQVTRHAGRIGVAIGVICLLLVGWYLCYVLSKFARKLILGAGVLVIIQLLPIVQRSVGALVVDLARIDGSMLHSSSNDFSVAITTEQGGFGVACLVGTILLIFAAALGRFLSLFLPRNWFEEEPATTNDV